jgi:aryl-alcohol dehydrogenase-like predicted oxidoreductase
MAQRTIEELTMATLCFGTWQWGREVNGTEYGSCLIVDFYN